MQRPQHLMPRLHSTTAMASTSVVQTLNPKVSRLVGLGNFRPCFVRPERCVVTLSSRPVRGPIPPELAARHTRRSFHPRRSSVLVQATSSEDVASSVAEAADVVSATAFESGRSQPWQNTLEAKIALQVLVERGEGVTLEELESLYPFPLDPFQREAIRALLKGESVVVAAPTSSGKTLVGEAAAIAMLTKRKKLIYTTPLKALSNQKMLEFQDRVGASRVGLRTGDTALQLESEVVVMTTEILRNMLYNLDDARWQEVGAVVLDEVHYLGDPSRGTVWEECIIYAPKHVQLVCLSATVGKPHQLAEWISSIRSEECRLVKSSRRPVPLKWLFSQRAPRHLGPGGGLMTLQKAITQSERDAEQAIRQLGRMDDDVGMLRERRGREGRSFSEEWDEDRSRSRRGPGGEGPNGRGRESTPSRPSRPTKYSNFEIEAKMKQLQRARVPRVVEVAEQLVEHQLLPAIWFIFSRKQCDTGVIFLDQMTLTNVAEQDAIRTAIDVLRERSPETMREDMVEPLIRGMASHHAGLLPAWKSLVERLFQQGHLKIVFATETLAAGINMPARTVVLSALSKRGDTGHSLLTTNSMLQMAGRAGRRGYDDCGYVVALQSPYDGADACLQILQRDPEALESQFSPGYGMTVNLLRKKSLEEAQALVECSFGNFLNQGQTDRRQEECAALEMQVKLMDKQLTELSDVNKPPKGVDKKVWISFRKTDERVAEEKRLLRMLRQQAVDSANQMMASLLSEHPLWQVGPRWGGVEPPTGQGVAVSLAVGEGVEAVLAFATSEDPMEAVCFGLGSDNRYYRFNIGHISSICSADVAAESLNHDAVREAFAEISPEYWTQEVNWRAEVYTSGNLTGVSTSPGSAAMSAVAAKVPFVRKFDLFVENTEWDVAVEAQRVRVKETKKLLRSLAKQVNVAKVARDTEELSEKLADGMARLERMRAAATRPPTSAPWDRFMQHVRVCVEYGALERDTLALTPLGLAASEVRGENELWLAAALMQPCLSYLEPPQLAAAIAGLLAPETLNRSRAQCTYPPSPEVVEAVRGIEPARQQLQAIQDAAGINTDVAVDLRLSGLVEAWASGANWEQIMADTTLDEGDVVRMLRRTADFLAQIKLVNTLPEGLVVKAAKAAKLVNRAPIADLAMF